MEQLEQTLELLADKIQQIDYHTAANVTNLIAISNLLISKGVVSKEELRDQIVKVQEDLKTYLEKANAKINETKAVVDSIKI